jgi:CheY-like chemotaxis protein
MMLALNSAIPTQATPGALNVSIVRVVPSGAEQVPLFTWINGGGRSTLRDRGYSNRSGSAELQQMAVISIVDDDESIREATKSLVRSLGYKAATFCSAEEFLGSPEMMSTACLIADIQMPGLSGVELQDRLIADGHCMPTIFVSAFPDERVQRKVLGSGAIGYLHKPYKEDRLIECIDAALKVRG